MARKRVIKIKNIHEGMGKGDPSTFSECDAWVYPCEVGEVLRWDDSRWLSFEVFPVRTRQHCKSIESGCGCRNNCKPIEVEISIRPKRGYEECGKVKTEGKIDKVLEELGRVQEKLDGANKDSYQEQEQDQVRKIKRDNNRAKVIAELNNPKIRSKMFEELKEESKEEIYIDVVEKGEQKKKRLGRKVSQRLKVIDRKDTELKVDGLVTDETQNKTLRKFKKGDVRIFGIKDAGKEGYKVVTYYRATTKRAIAKHLGLRHQRISVLCVGQWDEKEFIKVNGMSWGSYIDLEKG